MIDMSGVIDELEAQAKAQKQHNLEGLADATLERIAEFFGKCVNDPGFCGFSVDEKTNEAGEMLSLTLVPCDKINDEPVRRVGR